MSSFSDKTLVVVSATLSNLCTADTQTMTSFDED